VTEFFEGDSEWAGLFQVRKESSKFGFCCRGDYLPHHMAENMNCTVGNGLWTREEIEIASCSRPGFRNWKVKCITFDGELQVGFEKTNSGFRVGVTIVKVLINLYSVFLAPLACSVDRSLRAGSKVESIALAKYNRVPNTSCRRSFP
jgi:hypothetical protein